MTVGQAMAYALGEGAPTPSAPRTHPIRLKRRPRTKNNGAPGGIRPPTPSSEDWSCRGWHRRTVVCRPDWPGSHSAIETPTDLVSSHLDVATPPRISRMDIIWRQRVAPAAAAAMTQSVIALLSWARSSPPVTAPRAWPR